jgi:hypothetical protein
MESRDEMIKQILDFHIWRLFESSLDDLLEEYKDITSEDDVCDDCRDKQERENEEGGKIEGVENL